MAEETEEQWFDGALFKEIRERLLATAFVNDRKTETQHIIYGSELQALAMCLDDLSSIKRECLMTIDRMNATANARAARGGKG